MGKLVYDDPINHISGKISKKYRTVYNYKRASQLKFTSVQGDRTTPETATELAIRSRFKICRAAAMNRSMDLSHLTQDQIDFLAQRDTAGGKKTMKAYLWYICGQEYDAQHGN